MNVALPPPRPTYTTGQIVHWPAAPLGWAQVVELRRTRVRLCYRCRTGRLRYPIVRAHELAARRQPHDPLLPLFNPLDRPAMGRKTKTFA